MFNFNFLDEYSLKYFVSNREINPIVDKKGKVENLTVKNQNGAIVLDGVVDLSGVNMKQALKIKKNEIVFSEEFAKINSNYFDKGAIIEVTLPSEKLGNQEGNIVRLFIGHNNVKICLLRENFKNSMIKT
jgi:hypothetical protein